ncbi:MAG: cryptochrome/photolyase family protein [Alphaproteobacteria bacterium]|nr:cryptochrome/photolyase family protein [Alphaproteobacteria bacterium]
MTLLLPVLGDQLSLSLASLRGVNPSDAVVLMVEVVEEATYVRHHVQKIALVLSAMRHHAVALTQAGWRVDYVRLTDPGNTGSFTGEVTRAITRHHATALRCTHPGEWRVLAMMRGWADQCGIPVEILEDDRFVCPLPVFNTWAAGRKQLRMEYFYREMRRRTGLLMAGDQPVGGQWNFDADNRKPASGDLLMPPLRRVPPDAITREVLALVAERFADHPGTLDRFAFPVTAAEAESAMERFIADALPRFGDHQDAMLQGQPVLWHSLLSPALNLGLLDPLALCRRVEAAYHQGHAPLNAVEGFIRQVIGWREYVRGIYWRQMPGYERLNALSATRALPSFYWTANTKMACVRDAVDQTLKHAYAHHIQRLMVTGTFALLAGINPHEVHEWYLAVYADAFEWVELPNTLGMSQFADGGLLASKPYAASGAYIDRMSDYCRGCHYRVAEKTGPRACPFNPLYWDFLVRHRDQLGKNPRLGPVFRTWDRMAPETQAAYRTSAAAVLIALDRGEGV